MKILIVSTLQRHVDYDNVSKMPFSPRLRALVCIAGALSAFFCRDHVSVTKNTERLKFKC